jgi:hypothetical protein
LFQQLSIENPIFEKNLKRKQSRGRITRESGTSGFPTRSYNRVPQWVDRQSYQNNRNYSGKEQPERLKHLPAGRQDTAGATPWDQECSCDPTRSIEKPELRTS